MKLFLSEVVSNIYECYVTACPAKTVSKVDLGSTSFQLRALSLRSINQLSSDWIVARILSIFTIIRMIEVFM